MNEKKLQSSIRNLAHSECCNYDKEHGCCLMTDGPCEVIDPDYGSVREGAICCDYFLEAVLPADWGLNDLIWYAIWYDDEEEEPPSDKMRYCERCGKLYRPKSSKAKYCPDCRGVVRREKHREVVRNRRACDHFEEFYDEKMAQ